MKILSSIIILVTILMVFSVQDFIAQTTCPPDLDEYPEPPEMATFEPIPFEIWGMVEFQYRETANGYEIKVDWSSLQNTGMYGLTDEELKQLMYKAVITHIVGDCNFEGTKQFVFYEETDCEIWKKCYLTLKSESLVYCTDDGWPGPDPDVYEHNGEYFYRRYSKFFCGTQCCQYIYDVECIPNPIKGGNYAHIIDVNKVNYPDSECPESQNEDCKTGDINPCESNCN